MALKIGVAGAGGRMGRMLLDAVAVDADLALGAALEQAASPLVGQDVGVLVPNLPGVVVSADVASALRGCEVLIDFTRPEATLAHLRVCRQLGVNAVIGTTGFTPEQRTEIAAAAAEIAVVFAPNMSIGVNVVLRLVAQASRALGADWDVEVFEAHHKHKVDAPSGTALELGRVAAEARAQTLDESAVYARQGVTGERTPGSIGFSVVRAGDIVGDHTVYFAGAGERIEITHRSSSRGNYAQGAMRAAKFLAGRRHGLFDMAAVLGLS